jgi:GNAT superfamily N-acetyltransferase
VTSTDALEDGAVLLRPAVPEDAAEVAELHLAARLAAVPLMPPPVHGDEEVREWLRGRVTAPAQGEETWVAEAEGRVVGYARVSRDWLDDLYVAPAWTRRGVGSALLQLVMALRPGGFSLWVFETNTPAQAFYAHHGLFPAERTDGRDNEEKAPDIRMVWPAGGTG